MELESSLQHSQEPAIEPDKSSPCISYPISWRSISIW